MLKVFSDHLMTLLTKLIGGMNETYLKHYFNFENDKEEVKESTPVEEFERLANQWSMHQFSPRTLDMSITSIQSAISREIMFDKDPFNITASRDLNTSNNIKDTNKYLSQRTNKDTASDEDCPKTEKMYQRFEAMKNVGKTKIAKLVFPGEGNSSICSSKDNIQRSKKRLSKKLPKSKIKGYSKEHSLDKMSPTQDSLPSNMTAVER